MWKIAICVLVPILILLCPVPEGLSLKAWQLFALYMAAMTGLILRPYAEAVVFLTIIGVSGIVFNNFNAMISGFSFSMVWLVFSAFLIGTAFISTGLGRRIAYVMIGAVGNTSLRLGYVACLTDLIISPATPSNAARTGGITYPIFQSIAVALGSEPGPTARKIGAYLTMTTYFASWATSCAFMTGIATMPLILSIGEKTLKIASVDWIHFAIASLVPALAMLFVTPLTTYFMCPPELKKIDNKILAAKGLAELGPMKKEEKVLAILFVLAVLGWAIGGFFNIDANAIAVAFVAALLVFKVVTWDQILESKGAWSTFVWYGGIVGVINALTGAKFFEWLGKFIGAHVNLTGVNDFVIIAFLVLIIIGCRYFFASGVVFAASVLPIVYTIGLVSNVPAIPCFFLVAYVSAYGGMVTHYSGTLSPILFGAGYVDQATWWKLSLATSLIYMVISFATGLPYWKITGIW